MINKNIPDTTSGFNSQKQVSLDPNAYNKLLAKIKRQEAEIERLRKGQPIKQLIAPYLQWEGLHVYSDYVIEEQQGQRLIVVRGRPARTIWLRDKPDLFIRFAELPETNDAYLSFASSYGLLQIGADWHKRGKSVDWPDRSEPLLLIGQFHHGLKAAFSVTQALVNDEQVSDYKRHRLKKWFDWHLYFHTQHSFLDLSGRIALKAQSLAGVLVLQLYKFHVTGKKLRVCQLPDCLVWTTRKKFCSDKHRGLFNAWKQPKRRKMVEIDGIWYKAAEQPKRGRPAKNAQNPSQKNARTKPGTGNI